jgi:Ser/Thr protein kinase RdoA (MazF antagonist)
MRPGTVFLKLGKPVKDEPTEITRPEVEFYQRLAPAIGCPPLIKCYDAAFDEATGRSHVLMEDLTGTHTQPEQHRAPSEEMSRRAVEALARVHSTSDLGSGIAELDCDWLLRKVFDLAWLSSFVKDLERNVSEFLKVADLSGKQKEMYRKMVDGAPKLWGRLLDKNGLTVTHGDLHWWNFLYPKDANSCDVRLFDWQLWHIDLGARDLAFLLALGGFAEPRPEIEIDLLGAYHEALGVPAYSWEMLIEDYRCSAIRNLNMPVIFWSQGKHESTWRTALRRALDSYERLECARLL